MPSFGVAVAWMVLAPLAYLTDVLAIAVVMHYRQLYHSADVAVISLLVSMATSVFLVVPIPAIMELSDLAWSHDFCTFYTWLSLTLRMSHLIVLAVLNVYWLVSMKTTHRGHLFVTSMPMKIAVLVSWFVAVIVGVMPASGGTKLFGYYEDDGGACRFMPYDVSVGFGMLFIVACVTSVLMGLVSAVDASCLLRSMKRIALSKCRAARFQLGSEVDGKAANGSRLNDRYNELTVAMELCRLGLLVTMVSAAVNELPYMIIQFLLMFNVSPRSTLEDVTSWLLLAESFLVPHVLWLFSKRYRHGLVYCGKLLWLRKTDAKESDASSCPLQAYRLRAKEHHEKIQLNGFKTLQPHLTSRVGYERSTPQSINGDPSSPTTTPLRLARPRPSTTSTFTGCSINGGHFISESEGAANGIRRPSNKVTPVSSMGATVVTLGEGVASSSTDASFATTDLDDGMAVLTEVTENHIAVMSREKQGHVQTQADNRRLINGGVNPEDYIIKNAAARSSAAAAAVSLPRVAFIKTGSGIFEEGSQSAHAPSTSSASSPCKSMVGTPQRQPRDVKRSASTNSRREWKERMLRKHLPGIFINSSSLSDEKEMVEESNNVSVDTVESDSARVDNIQMNEQPSAIDNNQLQKDGEKERDQRIPTLKNREPSPNDSYYISSEYHHKYLGNSLPRRYSLRTQGTTESDGLSYTYDAEDIGHILDDSVSETNCASVNVHKDPNVLFLEDTDIVTKQNAKDSFLKDTHISNKQEVRGYATGTREENIVQEISPALNSQYDSNSSSVNESHRRPVPNARRSRYKHFMRNSSLKVSSVDEEEITDGWQNEKTDMGNFSQNKDDMVLFDLDANSPILSANHSGSDGKFPPQEADHGQPQRGQQQQDPNGVKSVAIKVLDENKKEVVDAVIVSQDYDQLETVSGNELLHLKLRAMRSATAVSFDDDEDDDCDISDEGGITNNAFENEELSISMTSPTTIAEAKTHFVESSSANDRYVYGSEMDNMNGDDNNDSPSGNDNNDDARKQPSVDSETVTPIAVTLDSLNPEESDSKINDRKTSLAKTYETNPFLRQSFEVLSQTPEYKQQISSLDNPFSEQESPTSQQSATTIDYPPVTRSSTLPEQESVIHVTSSAHRPPLLVKSLSSSSVSERLRNKPPIPAKPKVKPLVPLKKPLRLQKPGLDKSNSNSSNSPPNHTAAYTTEERFNRPRTSSDDELEKIFVVREGSGFQEDPSITVEDPSTKSMPILNSASSSSRLATSLPDISETGGKSIDHSIVIEPYGHRRPPWLDEVDPSLESSQDSVHLSERETLISDSDTDPNVHPGSPDFAYTVQEFKPCEVVEYHLDAVNLDGNSSSESSSGYGTSDSSSYLSSNGPRKTSLYNGSHSAKNNVYNNSSNSIHGNGGLNMITPVSTEERPTIQFYNFEDDIERGFEDALSMDYVTQSNAYSGFGLCFESIKEEPEDSLSESISSFDGLSDSNASNLFKTQAVVSRPSSRASVASSSNLELVPANKSMEEFNYGLNSTHGHWEVNPPYASFNTTERTSADGREEIASIANGNGCHQPLGHKGNYDIMNSKGAFSFSLDESDDFWKDFRESNGDSKMASVSTNRLDQSSRFDLSDDVFLSTSDYPADTPSRMKSPWLEIKNVPATDLNMSFDSDFSHQSGDELDDEASRKQQTPVRLEDFSVSSSKKSASDMDANRTASANVEPVYF